MASSAVQEKYALLDTRELLKRVLKTYTSASTESVYSWVAKFQVSLIEDELSVREQIIKMNQVILDGLQYGNWPKDLDI